MEVKWQGDGEVSVRKENLKIEHLNTIAYCMILKRESPVTLNSPTASQEPAQTISRYIVRCCYFIDIEIRCRLKGQEWRG